VGRSLTLTFRRPVAATESTDVTISPSLYILWAVGASAGTASGNSLSYAQHAVYGSVQANLFSGALGDETGVGSGLTPAAVLLAIVAGLLLAMGVVRVLRYAFLAPQAEASPAPSMYEMSKMAATTETAQSQSQWQRTTLAPSTSRASLMTNASSASIIESTSGRPHPAPLKPLPWPGVAHSLTTLLHRRMPYTDHAVGVYLLALLLLGLNAVGYFVGYAPDMARKFGTPRPTYNERGKRAQRERDKQAYDTHSRDCDCV
jgi:hypothetical protein